MAEFGKTWWGKKWLEGLAVSPKKRILEEGKSFAVNGLVKSIKNNHNVIKASFQYSERSQYRIQIELPPLNSSQKELLSNLIIYNESIFNKIVDNELPEGFFKFVLEKGIRLIPQSWKGIRAFCSCPEQDMPCSHIAAVVYLIAAQIDNNPLLVFQLNDFDFSGKAIIQNVILKEDTFKNNEFITTIDSLFKLEKVQLEDKILNQEVFQNIDFTQLKNIGGDLKPLFLPGKIFSEIDFQIIFEYMYKKIEKEVLKNYHKFDVRYFNTSLVNKDYDRTVRISFIGNFNKYLITYYSGYDSESDEYLDGLILLLQGIKADKIFEYSNEIIVLYLVYQFCYNLLEKSAFLPEFIKIHSGTFNIRWIPALNNEEVLKIFNQILEIVPINILSFKRGIGRTTTIKYPTQKEQLISLCSLFLNNYIWKHFSYLTDEKNDEYLNLFFTENNISLKEDIEKSKIDKLQLWISNHEISHKDYGIVLKVDENNSKFTIEVLIEKQTDESNELIKHISWETFFSDNRYAQYQKYIKADINKISVHFPDLQKITEKDSKSTLTYNQNNFSDILFSTIPTIKLFGIKVYLPESLKHLTKPQVSLNLKHKGNLENVKLSYFNLEDLLEFDWQIALGDNLIDREEFLKLISGMSGIFKYKDKFFVIEKKDTDKLINRMEKQQKISKNELLKIALTEEYRGSKILINNIVKSKINDFLKVDKIELPDNLLAKLRPYQLNGYEWLYKNAKIGFGSLIADDMGLGKTLQVLTTLLKFKQEGSFEKKHALIIVPTTILTNWKKEIEQFTPDLNITIYHGAKRELELENSDLIITTYGTIRNDVEKLKHLKIYTLIIDEAQNIKNPNTDQTKAVKKLNAEVRIAMTGTPVENRLSEYWSIFDFINKGYLGDPNHFQDEFTIPIQMNHDKEKLKIFKKITQPFIIRRLKTDKNIIDDLPDKIENNLYCSLTKEQVSIYQNVIDNIMNDVKQAQGINRKGLVLKLMTALKQICNHPFHYLKKGKSEPELSGKTMLLFNILENILENNEKTLIFTQYKEMGDLLVKLIDETFKIKTMFLHGGTSRKNRDLMVNNFQEKKNQKIFILSLKAGGTGLNLTAATNVIHYDLWWNPAVETQATDRAYRIGQNKNVMVYRLLTKGTFEEKIDAILQSKKELASLTVASGEKWIGDLSNNELQELVRLTE
jgi:SNF2 family DNA or RNA helicase/uncharacterized Zn finger protein